jgi:hypothetical protein
VLPPLARATPLGLLTKLFDDRAGRTTDWYVLTMLAVSLAWLSLVGLEMPALAGPLARGIAVVAILWRVAELLLAVLLWVFVERDLPEPRRAVLLFCMNLVEIRLIAFVLATLLGAIPVASRWTAFLGRGDYSLPTILDVPYQMMSWVILALAVGAVAGSVRRPAGAT